MLKLGYNFWNLPDPAQSEAALTNFLELGNHALELTLIQLPNLKIGLSPTAQQRISQFKYISLHAPVTESIDPVTGKKKWLRYPSPAAELTVKLIKQLNDQVNIQTVLFHPDVVDDFNWLNQQFKEKLAFENMDNLKSFGKDVADLHQVFTRSPQAKFVLDVNHVYTNDPTMKLATDLHQHFGERLCHYHVSAYNGFHDVFATNPNESVILTGIQDLTKPLIHEGGLILKDKKLLTQEDKFLREQLQTPN